MCDTAPPRMPIPRRVAVVERIDTTRSAPDTSKASVPGAECPSHPTDGFPAVNIFVSTRVRKADSQLGKWFIRLKSRAMYDLMLNFPVIGTIGFVALLAGPLSCFPIDSVA